MKNLSLAFILLATAAFVSAQTQATSPSPYTTTQTVTTTTVATTSAPVPAAVPTVSRTIKATHYRIQGGSTKIDFHGSDQMQRGSGEAKIEGKKTNFEIDAKFQGFEDATKFGLEYLTYVLWAISPEGRPVNLGELTLDHHGNAQVKAYTDLQTFGMIVTAEPYFAVSQPGNLVVAESNSLSGASTDVDAKYELAPRGTYSATNSHINDAIFGIDPKTPLELFEARNAVRIAHIADADKYAASILSKAGQQLLNAETLYRQKQKEGNDRGRRERSHGDRGRSSPDGRKEEGGGRRAGRRSRSRSQSQGRRRCRSAAPCRSRSRPTRSRKSARRGRTGKGGS